MSDPEGFLSRWARLKREADETPQTLQNDASTTPSPDASRAAPSADGVAPPVMAPADELGVDLSALPSIDSITAATDIRGFLAPGVPAELTRAALRRAWVADPKIRDFIGIAENQWDFNDPNGIPGFGRLDATESGVIFLAQVSSTPGEMPDLLAEGATPVGRVASNTACSEQSEADQHAQIDARQSPSTDSVISSCAMAEARAATKAAHGVEEYDASCSRRSHGSALPK